MQSIACYCVHCAGAPDGKLVEVSGVEVSQAERERGVTSLAGDTGRG